MKKTLTTAIAAIVIAASAFAQTHNGFFYDGFWNEKGNESPILGLNWNDLSAPSNETVLNKRVSPSFGDYLFRNYSLFGILIGGLINAYNYNKSY